MANIISNLTQMPNLSGVTKAAPSVSNAVSQAKSAIPSLSNITQAPNISGINFQSAASSFIGSKMPSAGNILNVGKGLIPGGAGGMLSNVPGVGSAMGNIALPGLGGGASNLFSGIQGQASSLLSGATEQISGLASGITGQLSGIGSSIGGLFSGGGLPSLGGLTSGLGSLGNIGNLAGSFGNIGNITGNFGNLGSLAGGFSNIGGAGSLLNSGAGSLLTGGATSMLGGVTGQLSSIPDVGSVMGNIALPGIGGGGVPSVSSLTSASDPLSLFDSMDFSQFAMGGFGASAVAAIYLKVLKGVSKKGKGVLEAQAKRYKMKKPFNFMMENPDAEELTKMSNTLFDSLSQGGDAYSDDKEFDESDWGSEGEDDSTPSEEPEQPTGAETSMDENKAEEESLPKEEFKGESTDSGEWSGESEIIKSEARVDKDGNLKVYNPPANDGGGRYEVAGFTEKYNKKEAQALMAAPPDQRRAMAEKFAAEKTKNANAWVTNGNKASKYVVQDTIFHRGDGGAAQMIKMSVGNPAYTNTGKLATSAKLTSSDIAKFNAMTPQQQISSLTAARKTYEAKVVGVRPNLQKGLDNRFNNTQSTALKHV